MIPSDANIALFRNIDEIDGVSEASMSELMFLNNAIFASDGITMLSLLITHLNPSSNENLILTITDLTRLEMRFGESGID